MVVTTRQGAAASAKRKREPVPPEPTPQPQPQPQPQRASAFKDVPTTGREAVRCAKASCLLQRRGVIRAAVFFSCETCDAQLSFRENCKLVLKKNMSINQFLGTTSHFLCAMRYLCSLDKAAQCEVVYRWRERMPNLSFQWGLFRKRRRFMLDMKSVTEELLQDPCSELERLLVHSVLHCPNDSKAAFVHQVASFLASD